LKMPDGKELNPAWARQRAWNQRNRAKRKAYMNGWRARHPGYATWEGMIRRCTSPAHVLFNRYGGRGVKVCARWFSYFQFLQDMGPRPEGAELHRLDNDGPYTAANCTWVSRSWHRHFRHNKPPTDEAISFDKSILQIT